MNYELTQKLKAAGFVQKDFEESRDFVAPKGIFKEYTEENHVYQPSLSELIEACGDSFDSLGKRSDGWVAISFRVSSNQTGEFTGFETLSPSARTVGKTPEEAVANLWLSLNK